MLSNEIKRLKIFKNQFENLKKKKILKLDTDESSFYIGPIVVDT